MRAVKSFGDRVGETLKTLFVAGVVFVLGTLAFGSLFERQPRPVEASEMARAFDHELRLAERAGLRRVDDSRASTSEVRREITLGPRECFSLIAGVAGSDGLAPLRFVDVGTGEVLVGEASLGTDFVRHLQWCSPRGGRYAVTVRGPSPPRIALYTGVPAPAALPLPRAVPSPEVIPRLRREVVFAAMAPGGAGATLLPGTAMPPLGAPMLLPSTPATRATLREALGLGADADLSALPLADVPREIESARVDDPPVAPVRPTGRGRARPEVPTPVAAREPAVSPLLRVLGLNARIVAVVDPGALGAGCVALRFALENASPSPVIRVEVPGWRVTYVSVTDGIARDLACPADGPRLYARFDPGSTIPLVFAVDRLPGAPGAVVGASAWRGESQSHSLVARLEAACARDARGCRDLAHVAQFSALRAPHPSLAEALRRGCERADGAACGRYGEALLAATPPAAVAALTALRRGCELGDGLTCAVLAAHERLGDHGVPQDIPAAFEHYARACASGLAAACAERDVMRTLRLAPEAVRQG